MDYSSQCRVPNLREAQAKVVNYIEGTFIKITEDIQIRPCGRPSIVLKRITDVKSRDESDNSLEGFEIADREIKISFPGKNKDEAWRFTCVGKILSEIYNAISSGEVVTKRDIYYRDPELFRSQKFVDRYVDIVAYTCGVTRLDLNVLMETASPKGLVAGLHENGEPYELIPDKSLEEHYHTLDGIANASEWKWILVVEKEATFKGLVENQFWMGNVTIGRGLVITGKGYPDLATQRFIRACANYQAPQTLFLQRHRPLILGLFDCDPDGAKILDIFRNGSKILAHERAYHVPEMRWLGIRPSDVFALGQDDSVTIPLTAHDRAKIKSMLVTDVESPLNTGLGAESRSALQWMKMLSRKAEIQILEDMPGGTGHWLKKRIEEEFEKSS